MRERSERAARESHHKSNKNNKNNVKIAKIHENIPEKKQKNIRISTQQFRSSYNNK